MCLLSLSCRVVCCVVLRLWLRFEVVLRCVVLLCVVLCCVALCCVVLCCDVCCDVLRCVVGKGKVALWDREYIYQNQKKEETNLNPNADIEEERYCVGSLLASEKRPLSPTYPTRVFFWNFNQPKSLTLHPMGCGSLSPTFVHLNVPPLPS
jgi:hypothetical protein